MKKFIATLAATLTLSPVTALAQEDNVIKIASQTTPMTDIVELAAENIAEPYSIELVEVTDNIQYNEAVFNDEADASFAQHMPFMQMFNEEKDADLVAIQPIYNAVVGFYAPEYKSIEDIEDGAEVAIPSDPTNEARALLILESYDLIDLNDEAGLFPTVDDVEENTKNLKFTNVDLMNLASAYEDGVDLVFNYPTYIAKIGLKSEDALIVEKDDNHKFAIQVVTREGNKDSEAMKAVIEAFKSEPVRKFVDELSESGHLVPAFDVEIEEDDDDKEDDDKEDDDKEDDAEETDDSAEDDDKEDDAEEADDSAED